MKAATWIIEMIAETAWAEIFKKIVNYPIDRVKSIHKAAKRLGSKFAYEKEPEEEEKNKDGETGK